MKEPIIRFSGEFFFLSNFYPHEMIYEGISYRCSESAYQAQKTENKEQFSQLNGKESKRLGRKVSLRKDWDIAKEEVMLSVLLEKFSDNDLKEKLLATGNAELIEGNNWGDIYWGVCNGKGDNQLGKLLMTVRNFYSKIN